MKGFIKQEDVYKLDSWLLQKKYHPTSTNSKIGVRGGKLLRTHGKLVRHHDSSFSTMFHAMHSALIGCTIISIVLELA